MERAAQTSEYLATFESGVRMVRILVRRLPVLLGVFVVAFAVAFLVRNHSPILYEANSLVVFAPPPYRVTKGTGPGAVDELSRMMPTPLSVQDYEIIAKSPPVLKTLRRKAEWKQDGKPIPIEDMRERIRATAPVIKKTNTEVLYSPILTLTVSAPNPDDAAKYVNMWADLVVEISNQHARSGTAGITQFLSTEFEKAGEQYEFAIGASASKYEQVLESLNEAKRFRETTLSEMEIDHAAQTAQLGSELQLDSWRARLDTVGVVLDGLRNDLAQTEVLMAEKANAVARMKEQLAAMEPKVSLNRGLTDTALPLVAMDRSADAKLPSVVAEEINEVYVNVSDRMQEAEADQAGAEARRTMLLDSIARLQEERETLTTEIKDRETKMKTLTRRLEADAAIRALELEQSVERLQLQADLEKAKVEKQMEGQSEMYSELNSRVLGARLAEAEIQPDMRVLVRGLATQDALPRRRVFTAGGIAVAATMLAAIVVLLLDAIAEGGGLRRRPKAA